jgi:hypothetical protein
VERAIRLHVAAVAATVVVAGLALALLIVRNDPTGHVRALAPRAADVTPFQMHLASLGLHPVPNGHREAKVFNSVWYRPETVVIGSSNVWSGVDTLNPALRQSDGRPAFNFGMVGMFVDEVAPVMRHVAAAGGLRTVVIGLEFFMFNAVRTSAARHTVLDYPLDGARFADLRLRAFAVGRVASLDMTWNALRAEGRAALDALSRALVAPAAASEPTGPTAAAPLSAARRSVIASADAVQISVLYGRDFAFESRELGSTFDHLRQAIATARAHGVRLRMFVSPHHARTHEIIRALGRWPAYEAWTRELARIVDEANRGVACADRVFVLDHHAYGPWSVDMTEAPAAEYGVYRLFGDSFHYRSSLGTEMMAGVMGYDPCVDAAPAHATPLSTANVEAHLAAIRERRESFAAAHPETTAEVGELVARFLAPVRR